MKYLTDKDIIGTALTLAMRICEQSKNENVYINDLANACGLKYATSFAPSANSKYSKALSSLIMSGCITQSKIGKAKIYRPLKPWEDIEAEMSTYKYDKRTEKTKSNDVPVAITRESFGGKETYYKIVEWLYENHDAYENAVSWRAGLIEFLKKTL